MPEYRRASTEGGTFFFTVVTYERRPILCLEKSLGIMRDVVGSVVKRHSFAVNSWVVLPDHTHCLWTLPDGDKDFSIRWALIKREFARGLRTALAGEAASRTEAAPGLSRERHREGTAKLVGRAHPTSLSPSLPVILRSPWATSESGIAQDRLREESEILHSTSFHSE